MRTPIRPGELFVFDNGRAKEYLMFFGQEEDNGFIYYHFLLTTEKNETKKVAYLKSWFEYCFNKGELIKRRDK